MRALPRRKPIKEKDRIERHVFGRPSSKDRDLYARQVVNIEAKPKAVLELEVTLVLECGHKVTGRAHDKQRRVPARIFCKECHQKATREAMAAGQKMPPLAPFYAEHGSSPPKGGTGT